ncbi:MAG: hypothetical protein ACJ76Y_25790 [Thermoanaerobaculia bacterium]
MREPFRSRLGLALVLAPVVGQFVVVFLLGVNTPVGDEFAYVDFVRAVREGGSWLPMVWWQHNEHRVVPVKLTMALLEPFIGWNLRAEMYVSAILAGLVVLGLWRLYRLAGGASLLLFAPVSWLYCNFSQYESMLYGLLMCHYFTAAGVVWALVFLARRSGTGIVLAVLCGLIASFSTLNGLLVWPLGLVSLLARGERPARTIAWIAAGAAAFVLYFFDFQQPPGLAALHLGLTELPRIAKYGITVLGAPLAAGSIGWSRAVGLTLLVLIATIAHRWLRRSGRARLRDDDVFPASLMLFGLVSCAIIAGGRASTGVPPLESRYIAYTSLTFVGIYLLISRAAERSTVPLAQCPWLVAILALFVPGVIAADLQGFQEARLWRATGLRDQFLLQTFDRQPDEVLGEPAFVAHLRRTAPYLRAHRLGAFAEPQRLLLLTRWAEREATGLVLPGRPIEQRLVCPVDELRDVALTLAREGPPDEATVAISVWMGGRRLAGRTLQVSALPARWTEVPLPEPLRSCQGRELTVRVESSNAVPTTRLVYFTFPEYYPGELRQAGVPLAPGRSLGLSLNGFFFGLLE